MQRRRHWMVSLGISGLLASMSMITATLPAVAISQATASARQQQWEQQAQQVRPDNYDLRQHPLTDAKESHWRNILWTTALLEPQAPYITDAVATILSFTTRSGLSASQQRTVKMALQVGHQLFVGDPITYEVIGQHFLRTIQLSPNPEWVSIALSGLVRAGLPADQVVMLRQQIQQRFPNWRDNVFLYTTLQDVTYQLTPSSLPPLADLLAWQVAPNQIHLYVICNPNRWLLCQAVLKDKQGNFVRQGNGELWSVPLLLRSLHHLSWNFNRGQTPQGIYRMEGVVPQPDLDYFRAYGQYDLVKMFVPYESGVKQFMPGRNGSVTSLSAYQGLLPPSWRSYFPIQQTYWAGKADRSLFRIHGTGDHPTLFANNRHYEPTAAWNPTIGCLSAIELYDESGRLVQADMPRMLATLRQLGGPNFAGYIIVVDVPTDSGQTMSLGEIDQLVTRYASR